MVLICQNGEGGEDKIHGENVCAHYESNWVMHQKKLVLG
jgi:hypothetical protein